MRSKLTADLKILQQRANILAQIRAFFAQRNILEIETPLLYSTPVTDPYLHAFVVTDDFQKKYLQTSPEFAMKRLLCAGLGDIYQICKAFRQEESGRLHHSEFTLLEWYRLNFNHHDLMTETDLFLKAILQTSSAQKISYQDLFENYLKINPHHADLDNNFQQIFNPIFKQYQIHLSLDNLNLLDKNDYLNLLFTHIIEPRLKSDFDSNTPVFIYDYPATQAALSKIVINKNNQEVSERFEVYIQGIELANGYHECQDAPIQRKRFEQDLKRRQQLNYPIVPIDEALLSAIEKQKLPHCSGIAMGIDRLIMIILNKKSISEVIAMIEN